MLVQKSWSQWPKRHVARATEEDYEPVFIPCTVTNTGVMNNAVTKKAVSCVTYYNMMYLGRSRAMSVDMDKSFANGESNYTSLNRRPVKVAYIQPFFYDCTYSTYGRVVLSQRQFLSDPGSNPLEHSQR